MGVHSAEEHRPAGKNRDWASIAAVSGALVVVLLLVGAYLLLRPRSITIHVDGPPGARFIGNVTVDQQATLVTGAAPAELTFRGRHLAFNVIPDSGSTDGFSVTLEEERQSSEFGAGGWLDARNVEPDVVLKPLTEDEWTRLRNMYRRQQISGGARISAGAARTNRPAQP